MTASAAPIRRAPGFSRIFGLGSIFAKTLRDSRRATLIVGGAIGILTIVVAAGAFGAISMRSGRCRKLSTRR